MKRAQATKKMRSRSKPGAVVRRPKILALRPHLRCVGAMRPSFGLSSRPRYAGLYSLTPRFPTQGSTQQPEVIYEEPEEEDEAAGTVASDKGTRHATGPIAPDNGLMSTNDESAGQMKGDAGDAEADGSTSAAKGKKGKKGSKKGEKGDCIIS